MPRTTTGNANCTQLITFETWKEYWHFEVRMAKNLIKSKYWTRIKL